MHAANFLLSRVSWNPEQALKTYFMGGIRNPRTLEIENFMDIKTLDDFWNWHQLNFCQDLIFVDTLVRAFFCADKNAILAQAYTRNDRNDQKLSTRCEQMQANGESMDVAKGNTLMQVAIQIVRSRTIILVKFATDMKSGHSTTDSPAASA